MEFGSEELWDFDGEEHGGEVEDYGVGECWEEYVRVYEHADRRPEIACSEGQGSNLVEVEIFTTEERVRFVDGSGSVAIV